MKVCRCVCVLMCMYVQVGTTMFICRYECVQIGVCVCVREKSESSPSFVTVKDIESAL